MVSVHLSAKVFCDKHIRKVLSGKGTALSAMISREGKMTLIAVFCK